MTDVTAAESAGRFKLPGLAEVTALLRRGDIALAVGVLTILVVLILPLPPILLDLALAISIIISVLILMTEMMIEIASARSSRIGGSGRIRSEEHTSELQSHLNLLCRPL